MKESKGLTLIEVLVILAIIAMLLAILMPARSVVKRSAMRFTCAVSLKGLGAAMIVYANDYDGFFPQLPGSGPWSKELGFSYDNPAPDFTGAHADTPRTISSSLYLLVREADVSPKSFLCAESWQDEFEGKNPKMLDLVELWDFGPDPYKHVSYCMQNPYGNYPVRANLPSKFAVAADMSPWFEDGNILSPGENKTPPQILNVLDKETWTLANSHIHDLQDNSSFRWKYRKYKKPGQNVLYSDGHVFYKNTPTVGVNSDNIYTYWSADDKPTEQDIQAGTPPTERNPENDAKSEDDSFLVL